MKRIFLISILLCLALQGCGQSLEQDQQTLKQEGLKLIASADGFDLTEADFQIYLSYVEAYAGETADFSTQIQIKSELKETFLKEPEKLLQQIQLLSSTDNSVKPTAQNPIVKETAAVGVNTSLAEGHKVVRQILGNDIGQMQFDVAEANTFRQFVANTLLTSTTGNYNKSVGGTGVTNTNSQTQFCANGTYTEALSGHVSIQTQGTGGVSSDTTYITGYWDVATLPNGTMIIVMYSTHPYVLEDWPNGVIPFVVAKYGEDFMALPSGDLYRRAANQYCN